MKPTRLAAILILMLALAACGDDRAASLPPPQEPGANATGTICRMSLAEHAGPKGQVFLKGQGEPLWFSSVRDTFTWLLVDEGMEKTVAAIYLNDMARATSWDKPEAGAWVEARDAVLVVGSDRGIDMGGAELVPFSDRAAAERFALAHGGHVLPFAAIDHAVLAEPSGGSVAETGGRSHE